MELKDLVGPHKMLYAARTDVAHPFDPGKAGIAFVLDDVQYLAFEDDNDGYRSQMGALFSAPGAGCLWSPDYIQRDVVCRHVTTSQYGDGADILEVIDAKNGHLWMRVGTDNIDDYYPSFIADWFPMAPDAS